MVKLKSINDYDIEDIPFFSDVINGLPRKILNYHTPEELFEKPVGQNICCLNVCH